MVVRPRATLAYRCAYFIFVFTRIYYCDFAKRLLFSLQIKTVLQG